KDIKIGILFSELKENSYEEYLIKLQKKIGNSIFIPNKECELERINNSEIVKYYWTFKQEDTLNKIKNYPNSNIISDFPEIYKNENQ
ncbi:MAG TPA: hypothetical protein DIV86_05990, partial [Alphaproteobacteria bacterium]|nr:hypothetical protein [Alphaproteobacteria bacterium]